MAIPEGMDDRCYARGKHYGCSCQLSTINEDLLGAAKFVLNELSAMAGHLAIGVPPSLTDVGNILQPLRAVIAEAEELQ